MKTKKQRSILFICTGNSCRSQMAEGFARVMLPGGWKIYSAGTIAAGVHPLTIKVMAEIGIDIADQYSKTVDEIPINTIDYVVTLCGDARDRCPKFPKASVKKHWPVEDPIYASGESDAMAVYRRVRDDIKKRMEDLAKKLPAR